MGLTTATNIQDLLLNWADEVIEKKQKIPATEVHFSDDPIALSWASYHVWQNFPSRRWVDLKDVEAHAHDREIAAHTRKYYMDRIMMQTLRGKPATEFQNTLYGLVSGENPIMSDQIGMLMKLPYFYTEDVTLDSVFEKTKSLNRDHFLPLTKIGTITPVAEILISRKNAESYQYWFEDQEGYSTCWSVLASNPLRSIVKSLYNRGEPLKIQANWHHARPRGLRSNHSYWNIANVELV